MQGQHELACLSRVATVAHVLLDPTVSCLKTQERMHFYASFEASLCSSAQQLDSAAQ